VIPKCQYLTGIRLCRRNAKKLYLLGNEAFEKELYHSAYLLGFASLEETGKALVILDYINHNHITYNQYKKKIKNHYLKIKKTMIARNPNILEVFRIAPREYVQPQLKKSEPRFIQLGEDMVDLRMDSIYIDYDFENGKWKKPKSNMKLDAQQVLGEAYTAYNCFRNECKHRGVRLRKSSK